MRVYLNLPRPEGMELHVILEVPDENWERLMDWAAKHFAAPTPAPQPWRGRSR